MRKKVFTEEEWVEIEEYYKSHSLRECAEKYGCSQPTMVTYIKQRFGEEFFHTYKYSRGGSIIFTEKEIEQLKDYARTHTLSECAAYFMVSPNLVYRTLKKRYGLYCCWGLVITDEDWEEMRQFVLAGGSITDATALYGKGWSATKIKNGLTARFGYDLKGF